MAVLSEGDRQNLWAKYMEDASGRRDGIGLTKAQLRAAIDAADDWVDSNRASFNGALPAAAQSNLTAAQKAEILMYVVRRRWEVE